MRREGGSKSGERVGDVRRREWEDVGSAGNADGKVSKKRQNVYSLLITFDGWCDIIET